MPHSKAVSVAVVSVALLVLAAVLLRLRVADRNDGDPAPKAGSSVAAAGPENSTGVVAEQTDPARAAVEPAAGPAAEVPYLLATVVERSGLPVAGARVTAFLEDEEVAQGTSAADGSCRLELPDSCGRPFRVLGSTPRAASGGVLARERESIVLVLREQRALRVRVLDDATGQPVAGCEVRAHDPDDWQIYRFSADSAVTGPDGTASLRVTLPTGMTTFSHPRYETRTLWDPTVGAAQGEELVVRLAPRLQVRVCVLDPGNRPVEGVTFGTHGGFDWEFFPVSHTPELVENRVVHRVDLISDLEVHVPGYAAARLPRIASPEDGKVVEVRLEPGATASGRITGLDSPEGATVTVWPAPDRTKAEVDGPRKEPVDEQGGFRVEGLFRERRYHVFIKAPGFQSSGMKFSAAKDQDVVDLGVIPLAPNSARPVVTGTVLDEAGSGIAGARITSVNVLEATYSDATGRFEHPSSTYGPTLQVRHAGYLDQIIEVRAGQDVEVRLRPSQAIRGVVVDDCDAPIPYAGVRLLPMEEGRIDKNVQVVRGWCDSNGRFELAAASDGEQLVMAEAAGHWVGYRHQVLAGQDVKLVLERHCRLEVILALAEGESPTGNWTVEISTGQQRWNEPIPRNERTARLIVRPGSMDCAVTIPGYAALGGTVDVTAGEITRLPVVPTR